MDLRSPEAVHEECRTTWASIRAPNSFASLAVRFPRRFALRHPVMPVVGWTEREWR